MIKTMKTTKTTHVCVSKTKAKKECTKLCKKSIRRLFAELSRYDSHFKSIGGYNSADC